MNKDQAKVEIKSDEGLRLLPYKDTEENWTIGYGHLMTAYEVRTIEKVTKEQADFIFGVDFHNAIIDCKRLFPSMETYSDARQRALVNMMFQIGETKLRKFKRMRVAIAVEDWGKAADECLDSIYARKFQNRAGRIARMLREG